MQVGKLFKVIVYVQDMQRQVEFYRDVLEFKLTYPPGLDDYADEMWVSFDTGGTTFALHGGGAGQAPQQASRYGFEVSQISAVREQLLGRGVKVGEIRQPAPGTLVLDCLDPEGNGFFLEEQQA